MFSSDLEKGAGAHTSFSGAPNTASHPAPADFPPKYESQVNYEMQRIGEAQPQAPKIVDIDYDTLAPSRKQSKRPMWFWAIIVGAVVALIIGAVVIAVHVANNKQSQETQSPMVTRSEPNTSTASMTASHEVTTVVVEPMTSLVYVTVTPPTPSTSTVVVVPSDPTSISTPVVTITLISTASTSTSSAISSSSSTSSSTTISATSSTVTTVVPFEAPITASPDSTVSSVSTVNLSELAVKASISAEMVEISKHLIPLPITQTVVSMTTETASINRIPVVSTASGVLYRCTVPGLACGK